MPDLARLSGIEHMLSQKIGKGRARLDCAPRLTPARPYHPLDMGNGLQVDKRQFTEVLGECFHDSLTCRAWRHGA